MSVSTRSEVSKSSGYEVALAVFGTFLASLDLYLILSVLFRHRSGDCINRIISTVFCAVLVAMCLESTLVSGPWPLSYIGGTNTVAHTDVLIFTLGFFLYEECLWMSWWWLGIEATYKNYMFHHLLCIASFSRLLYRNKCGPEAVPLLGLSQATVPLVHMYWFLRESASYKCLNILTCIYTSLFMIIRLGMFGVLLFVYFWSTKCDIFFKLIALSFYCLNVVSSITWSRRVYEICFM